MIKIAGNILYALRPIWAESKLYIALHILFSFERIPARLFNVLIVQYMVDAAVTGIGFRRVAAAGIGYGFYVLVTAAFKYAFTEWYAIPQEETVRKKITEGLYRTCILMPLSAYDDTEFYDTYVKAFSVSTDTCFAVFQKTIRILEYFLSITTLCSVITVLSPSVLCIVLIGSLLSLFANFYRSRLTYEKEHALTFFSRKLDYISCLFYQKQYAKDMRTEPLPHLILDDYEKTYGQKIRCVRDFGKKTAISACASAFPLEITDVVIWLVIVKKIMSGVLQAGSFMALSNAAWSLSNQLRQLFKIIPELYRESLRIDHIRRFKQCVPHTSSAGTERSFEAESSSGIGQSSGSESSDSGFLPLEPCDIRRIEMVQCCFSYGTAPFCIHGVSFSLERNKILALVGHNGAGKSTLVQLLLRLYEPASGKVLINGTDYRLYDPAAYRRCTAAVFQDYHCYAYTIAKNILMRTPAGAEDEKLVIEALQKVRLYDKVSALPKGIYSVLTKEFDGEGILFSGGELQKLSIARALAKNAPVLALDEPSSALDPLAEAELQTIVREVCRDKLVIVISHRLSMTKMADHILLLENGRIAEEGSHSSLLQLNGKYAELWYAQAQHYEKPLKTSVF